MDSQKKMFFSGISIFLMAAASIEGICQGVVVSDRMPEAESVVTQDDVIVYENVEIPMRDGVKLAADICLPAKAGVIAGESFPVLLVRTPYGKWARKTWAQWGYGIILQDVRGRHRSEGVFYPYIHEEADGVDTVEWVAAQPWCDGRIATMGSSYMAATQNAIAASGSEHLKGMCVEFGTANYIEDGAGRGGAYGLLHNLCYAMSLAKASKEVQEDAIVKAGFDESLTHQWPWLLASPFYGSTPFDSIENYKKWYLDWQNYSPIDSYWEKSGYYFEGSFDHYPDVPMYFIGGWYDLFKRGTLSCYQGLSSRKKRVKLLMGPWVHGVDKDMPGDVRFGPEASLDFEKERRRWFDAILLGKDTGILEEPPVRYFVMGAAVARKDEQGHLLSGGEWKDAESWPPEECVAEKWYLRDGGMLSREIGPGEKEAVSRYLFDPADPVPTIGGNIASGSDLVGKGAYNQIIPQSYAGAGKGLPISARADVLMFQAGPLTEDVEIAGPIEVKLWVGSEGLDTDFTAKLIDVYPPSTDYPNGYAMNLEEGILRMRYRNGSQEQLLEPGRVYPITIDLWSTANRFYKGHRIRLDISSSNFPMYDVNPNTGRSGDDALGEKRAVINTVYHDRDHPSCLIMSVNRASQKSERP